MEMPIQNISDPLLNIEGLSVGYGAIKLLSDLNLELQAGELVCFMGSNGIGKSTLIKTLIGLVQPLAGKIEFYESGPIEKIVSVVLTDRVQHPHITVRELIDLGRYPHLDWRGFRACVKTHRLLWRWLVVLRRDTGNSCGENGQIASVS